MAAPLGGLGYTIRCTCMEYTRSMWFGLESSYSFQKKQKPKNEEQMSNACQSAHLYILWIRTTILPNPSEFLSSRRIANMHAPLIFEARPLLALNRVQGRFDCLMLLHFSIRDT